MSGAHGQYSTDFPGMGQILTPRHALIRKLQTSLPRLIVDIDVVYTPWQTPREQALKAVSDELDVIAGRLGQSTARLGSSVRRHPNYLHCAGNWATCKPLVSADRRTLKNRRDSEGLVGSVQPKPGNHGSLIEVALSSGCLPSFQQLFLACNNQFRHALSSLWAVVRVRF